MWAKTQSIIDVFQTSVDQHRDKIAFTCLGRSLTFGDIDTLSGRFAAYLQQNTSLQPGDRIAIMLPNVLQYPVVAFGALRAGLVIVNTNPLYTPREVQHQLRDSGAKALVVLANVAHTSASIIEDTDVETVFVTEVADLHPPLKRFIVNSVIKYVHKAIPPYKYPKSTALLTALKADASKRQSVAANPDDIAVLQYTGGTTGVAKGAMLTHSNLVSNMNQLLERIEPIMEGENLCFVTPLPLYHIYAFTCHCMANFSRGHHNLLIPNPRDIASLIKAMQDQEIFAFVGLNTLFNALLNNEEFKQLDFKSWGLTASGGMALTKDTARRWEEVTGVAPCEGYGLTETSPVVSSNPPLANQVGTIGLPVIDTEVKVIDEDGNSLPRGEVGELCVRGPQVMKGYWQRQEATDKVLDSEGWFKTGDMALQQDDDYLRIVDRKKDMVLVSGFNVYPNEVEDIISEHAGVVEAGVIGVEDEHSGEVVKAFVVKSDPNLDEDSLISHCKKNMAAYKVPKLIEFCDELPKSAVGKILRRELKEMQSNKAAEVE